ncbi:hypothetical protein DPMN_142477 [Dreissena polymorpha]|uniref:Uncharacterized protein n=1 Tax=Dreissena polymorpha TaxID=45954 RepID=A0A9D4GEI4_DREPO|nr:hypothetical protein DPMN_142477 [Dreissena polymorpha]
MQHTLSSCQIPLQIEARHGPRRVSRHTRAGEKEDKTNQQEGIDDRTVPWDTRCGEAYERKMGKYTELQKQCKSRGWDAWLFPVEIGCR